MVVCAKTLKINRAFGVERRQRHSSVSAFSVCTRLMQKVSHYLGTATPSRDNSVVLKGITRRLHTGVYATSILQGFVEDCTVLRPCIFYRYYRHFQLRHCNSSCWASTLDVTLNCIQGEQVVSSNTIIINVMTSSLTKILPLPNYPMCLPRSNR